MPYPPTRKHYGEGAKKETVRRSAYGRVDAAAWLRREGIPFDKTRDDNQWQIWFEEPGHPAMSGTMRLAMNHWARWSCYLEIDKTRFDSCRDTHLAFVCTNHLAIETKIVMLELWEWKQLPHTECPRQGSRSERVYHWRLQDVPGVVLEHWVMHWENDFSIPPGNNCIPEELKYQPKVEEEGILPIFG